MNYYKDKYKDKYYLFIWNCLNICIERGYLRDPL